MRSPQNDRVTFDLPKELVKRLDLATRRSQASRSALIRQILEIHLPALPKPASDFAVEDLF